MKTPLESLLAIAVLTATAPSSAAAEQRGVNSTVQAGSATGGSAVGGSAMGGSAVGGSARGGDAVGGSATGGSARGGDAAGGVFVGDSVTGAPSAHAATTTPGIATPGTATANVAGRRISATADRGASIQAQGSGATVQLGDHVLVIKGDQVLVDGEERARLPASADAVAITLRGDMLTVRADDADVIAEKLP
jgi:hypothetical protein